MAEPRFLEEQGIVGDSSGTWAWVEGDECLWASTYRNEHCGLCERVEELERRLRRRTMVLVGALALSALLNSFIVASFHKAARPTVALAVAPAPDALGRAPLATWQSEPPSETERSQAWAMAEEHIEAMATRQFDARRTQPSPGQPAANSGEAGRAEAMKPQASAIHGDPREAVGREWSPASKTDVSASSNQDGSEAARPNEGSNYTAKDFVNLRAAPNNSAEVLAVITPGDLVRQTGRKFGWLQVEFIDHDSSNIIGWVYGSFLRRVETSGETLRQ